MQGGKVGNLRFNFYFCGMSEETFSKQIMIYKPNSSIIRNFTEDILQKLSITYVSQLICYLRKDTEIAESLGTWGLENFSISTVYIQHHGYLLGMQEDKPISAVFHDLETHRLEFAYFVVGGASIHNETSYRFTIHPDEKIHEYLPHVHVSKAGVEIRYSLETLLPIDPLVNPHKRDNKKIITPFLQHNQKQLLEMWNYYMEGYTTPEITQEGQQFYSES